MRDGAEIRPLTATTTTTKTKTAAGGDAPIAAACLCVDCSNVCGVLTVTVTYKISTRERRRVGDNSKETLRRAKGGGLIVSQIATNCTQPQTEKR